MSKNTYLNSEEPWPMGFNGVLEVSKDFDPRNIRAYIRNRIHCERYDMPHSYYSNLGVLPLDQNYDKSIENMKFCFSKGCSFVTKGLQDGRGLYEMPTGIYGNIQWGECMETRAC